MRRIDRWMLGMAYVLLVGFVVYMSWDLDRRLTYTQDLVCATANVQYDTVRLAGLSQSDDETAAANEDLMNELVRWCGPGPEFSPVDLVSTWPIEELRRFDNAFAQR